MSFTLAFLAFAIAVGFLVFCWVGFRRSSRLLDELQKARHVFPHHRRRGRNEQAALLFGIFFFPLVAACPQAADAANNLSFPDGPQRQVAHVTVVQRAISAPDKSRIQQFGAPVAILQNGVPQNG